MIFHGKNSLLEIIPYQNAVILERFKDSAHNSISFCKLSKVFFYGNGKSAFKKVNTKDVGAVKERVYFLPFDKLRDRRHYLRVCGYCWIWAEFKGVAVVVDCLEITEPECKYKRQDLKSFYIKVRACKITFDCFSETDAELLLSIAGNSLRSVRHKRIWDSYIHNLVNKIARLDNSRVYYYRKAFFITESLYKTQKVLILHFI